MGCIINSINNISVLNVCEFSIPGIKQLWIGNYDKELINNIVVFDQTIISMNSAVKFEELKFNQAFSRYTETFNYGNQNYDQSFTLELVKFDYIKRDIIDSLIKAKLIFIFKDYNNKYFLLGETSGIYSNSYSGNTDASSTSGKSNYIFTFISKSNYGLLGVDESVVKAKTEVNCDDLLGNQFYDLYLNDYLDCIVPNN